MNGRSRYMRNRARLLAGLLFGLPMVLVDIVSEYDENQDVTDVIRALREMPEGRVYARKNGENYSIFTICGGVRRQFVTIWIRRVGTGRLSVTELTKAMMAGEFATTVLLARALKFKMVWDMEHHVSAYYIEEAASHIIWQLEIKR